VDEVVVAYFKVLSWLSLGDTEETTTTTTTTTNPQESRNPIEIRTRDLPNTNLERYPQRACRPS